MSDPPTSGAPHFYVQPSPIIQLPSAVAPAGQPCTHVHPTITPIQEPPTLYPPPEVEMVTKQTYASYPEDSVPYLAQNDQGSWVLCLPIPIPTDLINPTLTSLIYVIKYATTLDNGNSTVQTDTVLTTADCPVGIIFKHASLGIYRDQSESAYSPRMINDKLALRLSMVPAVKFNGGNSQWSHYIDHRHLIPNVRIHQPSNLYLNFHVAEYPTTQTSRSLAIEVSASWAEDLEARKAREEAKKAAPPVADERIQLAIQNVAEQYGVKCSGGFDWKKTEEGYECGGGGHKLTFEQLGM